RSSRAAWSAFLLLAGEALKQALDLAVLLALAVRPFPDHLLLGAHMRNEPLDRFREVRHRRCRAAAATFLDGSAEPLDYGRELAGGGPAPAAAIFAHRRGQPVLEIGVEAVLRLARLQVEKTKHQRTRKAEQRGRERNAHAAERRGEPVLEPVEQRAGIT